MLSGSTKSTVALSDSESDGDGQGLQIVEI
jgi:hypothetical protein